MKFLYIVLFICLYMLVYFLYMIIREGICRVVRLYFIAYTGWGKYRNRYRYSNSILALKRLNIIFSKYTLYRMLSV